MFKYMILVIKDDFYGIKSLTWVVLAVVNCNNSCSGVSAALWWTELLTERHKIMVIMRPKGVQTTDTRSGCFLVFQTHGFGKHRIQMLTSNAGERLRDHLWILTHTHTHTHSLSLSHASREQNNTSPGFLWGTLVWRGRGRRRECVLKNKRQVMCGMSHTLADAYLKTSWKEVCVCVWLKQ